MGFTIRHLSEKAEYCLNSILQRKSFVNTKTKGIEYVLENYLFLENSREENLKEIENLEEQILELKEDLSEIRAALKILKNFT